VTMTTAMIARRVASAPRAMTTHRTTTTTRRTTV